MRTDPPAGLMDAFWAYEHALGTDDLTALDRLFAPGPGTLRGDGAGLLVGHEQIAAFRGTRGGAPARRRGPKGRPRPRRDPDCGPAPSG